MSNEYKIEVGEPLIIVAKDEQYMTKVVSVDGARINCELDKFGEEFVELLYSNGSISDLGYSVIDLSMGKTKIIINSIDGGGADNILVSIELVGETEHPIEAKQDTSYMLYSCPSVENIADFIDDNYLDMEHPREEDSIYGVFFDLFKKQERRIQALEKALIGVSNTNVSH